MANAGRLEGGEKSALQAEQGPDNVSTTRMTGEKQSFKTDEKFSPSDLGPSILLKNGIALHPQPTSDPLDPLNWSGLKKHTILSIIMALYFMFTYITTTTVPSFPELMEQYDASVQQINWTLAIPALGLAVGPLLWSSPADIIGRRSIFILGTIVALASTIGAAKASTYSGYMAARFFQGLGVSPAATVGLAIINDIFFDYQRGQKVGLWVLAIDTGILIGPLVGGFVDLINHYWIQWLTAIIFAVILLAELFLLPETLYPRNYMLEHMPYSTIIGSHGDIETTEKRDCSATDVNLSRTTSLPFINIKRVPGILHASPWDALVRFGITWRFLAVSVSVFTYCFTWYWWLLTIVTLIPLAYVDYSPQSQGLLFIGLIIGTLVSEICFSGTLSDWIVLKLAKKNHDVRVPEMRLWLSYPAAILSATGLIIWGISVDQNYHWIVGQVAFVLFSAGIQMGNTAICSYMVDCYPLQSMAMVTFYSVLLNGSAFVEPFFIVPWLNASGYTWTLAAQGIITAFLACGGIGFVHWKGAELRARNGQPSWVNPEYDSSL